MNNPSNIVKLQHVTHPFEPIFNEDSLILILGSFPSVKSREESFYYAHPGNRFWKLMANITETDQLPTTVSNKKEMLLKNKIAVWDVIKSCDINKSSDSSIKNVEPNDISGLILKTEVKNIFINGSKAYNLYMKYCLGNVNIDVCKLPSTSAANATYSFDALLRGWSIIKNVI